MGGEIINIVGSTSTSSNDVGGRQIGRAMPNKLYIGRSRSRSDDIIPSRRHHSNRSPIKHSLWWNTPDVKRKRRVAQYKFYTVEGKVKSSIKKGLRWFKRTCSRIVRGF